MRVFLANYRPRDPFDREDCETCIHNPVDDERVLCTNEKAVQYMVGNSKCKEYHERETD